MCSRRLVDLKKVKTVAFILARKNSKRLKNKNTLDFCGKPLILWTIEAALKSKLLDKVIVSTDCKEIADIASQTGAEVPFLRPAELAMDGTSSLDVVNDLRNWCIDKGYLFDNIVLLQPTSPLRTSNHIDEALNIFNNSKKLGEETLISVYSLGEKSNWLYVARADNYLAPAFDKVNNVVFLPNGAIYIAPFSNFNGFVSSQTIPFIMKYSDSIDIDTVEDFELAKYFFMKRKGEVET